jgi:hypothetical protein
MRRFAVARTVWNASLTPALALVACGALLATAPSARGQEKELPEAKEILDQYVKAIGGKDAYDKIKDRVVHGTFEVPAQQLKGSITIYAARPNLLYSVIEMRGMRDEHGTDGKLAWENHSVAGPRLLEGAEREQLLRDAVFDPEVQWQKLYEKVKTTGIEDVNGKPAYQVELTDKEENKTTHYYDQKSHLLVKIVTTRKTQMGDVAIEDFVSDYKKVGKKGVVIIMPHKHRQVIMGTEQVLTFEPAKVNSKLSRARFKPPEEIQRLAKEKENP